MMLLNFDYDGVIVDSLNRLLKLVIQAQENLGVGRPPTRQDFATIQNLTFEGLGQLIGIPEDKIDEYAAKALDLHAKDTYRLNLIPKMASTINRLSENHHLVIVTSGHIDAVFRTLKVHNLQDKFYQIMGAELGLTKAERITQVREELGVDWSQTYMIGDTMSDIRQGKLAGARTIAVAWGYQDRELLIKESPDFMASYPEQLLEILA